MRYSGKKGWQCSYKDTYSLDMTLEPIIYAGLVKFKEVVTSKGFKGVPANYLPNTGEPTRDEVDAGYNLFLDDLDRMIHAFRPEEENNDTVDLEYIEKIKKDAYEREQGRIIFAKNFRSLWW